MCHKGNCSDVIKTLADKAPVTFRLVVFVVFCFCIVYWKGFGDFKIGGQIIHTVKYADDLVLLAKE
jgi:hypothetical protein